jgi:hypothetical protein
MTSFLIQYGVQDPTTKGMPHLGPAMPEDFGTATAVLSEGIGEERHLLKRLLLVNVLGDLANTIILSYCR